MSLPKQIKSEEKKSGLTYRLEDTFLLKVTECVNVGSHVFVARGVHLSQDLELSGKGLPRKSDCIAATSI